MRNSTVLTTSMEGSGSWRLVVPAVGAALLGLGIDAVIFLFAPANSNSGDGFPPAWVIGSVWVLLFALMGTAWGLLRGAEAGRVQARWSIVALLLSCAAYPFYTGMFTSRQAGLAGNVATIFMALVVSVLCSRRSRQAGALILPTAAWVLFATFLTLREVR